MDYLKSYKSFLYGHHLSDGIRITIGIIIPAFVMLYLDMLNVGIVMSIGALCVSGTDIPGAITHRRNAMLICIATVFIVTLLTGLASGSKLFTGLLLTVCCFGFSMLGVFGMRATALGLAALLVMVLNMNYQFKGAAVIWNAVYIIIGGTWYFLFSMALHRLRPYKLVQQAMGDYLQSIADYLETRASFYLAHTTYDTAYEELVQKQIIVQHKHELVSELIFKTRTIVRESTHIGRILVMIFIEASELFDRIMTSYQDFATLHSAFEKTEILKRFHDLAILLKQELEEIGLALKSGRPSVETNTLIEQVSETRKYFSELRESFLHAENIEEFINLRRILDNIQDMANRLHTLHQYTTFNKKISQPALENIDTKNFVQTEEITWERFRDNLGLKSNIFRHALRVTLAATIGFLIAQFMSLGHSYWIILTIIVILKPAYSLTQQRNKDRILGTICGALLGVLVLFLTKNAVVLLTIMIVLMMGTNVFIRQHYFTGVLMMTAYILIFFHLLEPTHFEELLKERIIDTAIGSVIAFLATAFVVPDWEHKSIVNYMSAMLLSNLRYFEVISNKFLDEGEKDTEDVQLARKDTLVALANLSDAFTRMLSEPKSKQKEKEKLHQFVVLSHRFTSHVATLLHYHESRLSLNESVDVKPVVEKIKTFLADAKLALENQELPGVAADEKNALALLYEEVNILLERRRQELRAGELETTTKKTLSELKSIVDQFKFIFKISAEISKVCHSLKL